MDLEIRNVYYTTEGVDVPEVTTREAAIEWAKAHADEYATGRPEFWVKTEVVDTASGEVIWSE